MKLKIFLSHSNKDSAYAELLAELLQEKGFEVWTDMNLEPGDNWSQKIKAALKDSNLFISLLSKEYLESEYALMELGAAYGLEKKIFPILLSGDVEQMPLGFNKRQVIDAQQMDKNALLHLIEQQAGAELAA